MARMLPQFHVATGRQIVGRGGRSANALQTRFGVADTGNRRHFFEAVGMRWPVTVVREGALQGSTN
jgi:hypothetical protein